MPLIEEVWLSEKIPQDWNRGSITSIWKGKSDRERLQNHRGITVSSAIGNIIEEIIDTRMEKLLKFSPGQAGGIKSAATADHLFLLRGLMATAIEQKTNLFVTFFDVTKAYDRADVKNMLHTIWNAGVKGKMWRLLKGLSTNLTAVVKTKFGPSREIERYNGGKQGSRIMGRLFAKQMDTLSEDFIENRTECVKISEDFSIGCLEWVDDVLSTTTGMKNQLSVLKIIDEFAIKNKLEWGESKCQVMQVGKKIQVPEQWQLGPKMIANTNSYKYLGDTVTNDNKNKRNLEIRENGVQAMIRQINTTASSDIMRGIESKVLLTLYETCIIPSLLNNCESWTLSKTEEEQIDKIGIRTAKRLFGLPTTTPSAAIIFNLGLLYTTQAVDKKRFIYIHKILNRGDNHWTKKMFFHLQSLKKGWVKNIEGKLAEYNLETNFEVIKNKTKAEWKRNVSEAVDEMNKNRLIQECVIESSEDTKVKTKTKNIHKQLTTTTSYKRIPLKEVIEGNKQRTKTLIIARHGMLQCGTNFKGTMPEICRHCDKQDDEDHRLNDCPFTNQQYDISDVEKCNFLDIHSENKNTLDNIVNRLGQIWEFRYANGRMKKVVS